MSFEKFRNYTNTIINVVNTRAKHVDNYRRQLSKSHYPVRMYQKEIDGRQRPHPYLNSTDHHQKLLNEGLVPAVLETKA